jgi:Flp pilus assembly pilin Flp
VKIRWSPAATALARRFLRDQDGMRAIGVAA